MGQQRTDRALRHSHRQQAARRRSRAPVDRQPRQQQDSAGIWFSLMRRYSPLLLVIAWVLLLGAAIAAVTAIVDPKFSVQSSALRSKSSAAPSSALIESDQLPMQQLTGPVQPRRSSSTETRSPLSTGGALLISCAGGCLLLSRCLQPQSAPRRKRRIPKLDTRAQPLVFETANEASRAAIPDAPTGPISSGIAQYPPQSEPRHRQPEGFAASSLPETPVSVLASDQIHPLDWDGPSLADSLDLRQKRPLSYWLRDE